MGLSMEQVSHSPCPPGAYILAGETDINQPLMQITTCHWDQSKEGQVQWYKYVHQGPWLEMKYQRKLPWGGELWAEPDWREERRALSEAGQVATGTILWVFHFWGPEGRPKWKGTHAYHVWGGLVRQAFVHPGRTWSSPKSKAPPLKWLKSGEDGTYLPSQWFQQMFPWDSTFQCTQN